MESEKDILFFSKSGIADFFSQNSWQRVMFSEFYATLTSEVRPFPCTFGVQGVKGGQIKYSFLEQINAENLGPILKQYLQKSKSFGPNTSLVVFSKPEQVDNIEHYHAMFWNILKSLAAADESPWPRNIPVEIDDRQWEFCYASEPIFVVCNTPAHVLRQSRRSSSFMLTFQPRWVFDGILGTDEKAERSFSIVRERLKPFDAVAVSPDLGRYGNEEIRESRQYFLADKNVTLECPYKALRGASNGL